VDEEEVIRMFMPKSLRQVCGFSMIKVKEAENSLEGTGKRRWLF
jgi:hypothetical protein